MWISWDNRIIYIFFMSMHALTSSALKSYSLEGAQAVCLDGDNTFSNVKPCRSLNSSLINLFTLSWKLPEKTIWWAGEQFEAAWQATSSSLTCSRQTSPPHSLSLFLSLSLSLSSSVSALSCLLLSTCHSETGVVSSNWLIELET